MVTEQHNDGDIRKMSLTQLRALERLHSCAPKGFTVSLANDRYVVRSERFFEDEAEAREFLDKAATHLVQPPSLVGRVVREAGRHSDKEVVRLPRVFLWGITPALPLEPSNSNTGRASSLPQLLQRRFSDETQHHR